MLELYVVAQLGPEISRQLKVFIQVDEIVSVLKRIVCTQIGDLQEDQILIVYGSVYMQDEDPLYVYNVTDGVTLNVFGKMKRLDVHDMFNLAVVFQALRMSKQYLNVWNDLISIPEVINYVIMNVSYLKYDVEALDFVQSPDKLCLFGTTNSIRLLMKKHPSLVSAILKVSEMAFKMLKMYPTDLDAFNCILSLDYTKEDIIHDSLEFATTNEILQSGSGAVNAKQFLPCPSQLSIRRSVLSRSFLFGNEAQCELTPDEIVVRAQLSDMNDLGLDNDIRNAAALKLSTGLQTAVELVLKHKFYQ